MSKRWLMGFLVVAGIASLVGWLRWDRDMWLINRRSEQMSQMLHKTANEGLLALAQRVTEISGFFSHSPLIVAGEPLLAISSHEELIATISTAMQVSKELKTLLLEHEAIWVQPHQKAVMHVVVEVTVDTPDEHEMLHRAYDLDWVREDDRWVIASAQLREDHRETAASGQ